MANLSSLLEDSTTAYPDRTAIVLGDTRLTYAQVNAAANQVANLLAEKDIESGDKIALACPNLPYFPIVYYGILKAGAVAVPLNILLRGREIAYHLDDSDAVAVFAFEGTPDLPMGQQVKAGFDATETCRHLFWISADPAAEAPEGTESYHAATARQPTSFHTVPADDDDTAVILYTSGTTGQPKGAELRHRNMADNARAGADLFKADPADPDTYLCTLPLFHTFGQSVIQNGAFAFSGTIVLQPRFEAKEALDLFLKEKITFFAGVPTMYWGFLGAAEGGLDVSGMKDNLRVAAAGGSALPREVHKNFRERFGVTILEGYGLSETSPVASFQPWGEEPRVGSIGKPIPGVDMKLINDDWSEVPDDPEAVGEIAVKGHNVMKGYYGRPEATAEALRDGWFRTGDLATKDADGWYYIVDRSKDMIVRGGFNVYPRELEEVLMEHPAVSLAAVIGVPHESHGEEIKALVVKNAGDDMSEQELVDWGREQFASYKYPRIVEFRDELPMTSTGKILKRELS